ncbi:MAG TPA: hypothetical protein VH138_01175 [Vicinamibacterales bacterium]|nr:hypothetical protein [Vicinamibacterales bacterium]
MHRHRAASVAGVERFVLAAEQLPAATKHHRPVAGAQRLDVHAPHVTYLNTRDA